MRINFALEINRKFDSISNIQINMKKVIAILAVLFAFSQFQIKGINLNLCENEKDEINLIEKNKADSFNDTRTRSLGPAVSAYLDKDLGQVEIVFSVWVGNATIYMLDQTGMAVQTYSCDTETEWIVVLPTPNNEGYYTLKIDSDAAEYTGGFTL